MKHLYNFGMSQEDERTEAVALDLGEGDRVLSIASAGDMPLSLLALGAGHVHAVDIDEAQLHLTRLKLAAVLALDRHEALEFLGFLPCPGSLRRARLSLVQEKLPEEARQFWSTQVEAIDAGAIWAGRYEQYVRRLVRIALPLIGRRRFEELFACVSLAEQEEVFRRNFDRPLFRGLFRLAFHPRIFSSRGMDPRSLAQRQSRDPLAEQYFAHFRALCTATPARDNHLLQLTLLEQVISTEATPAYLSERGVDRLRDGVDRLTLHRADLVSFLQGCEPGTFNKAHLSNVPDWLSRDAFEDLMRLLAARAPAGARLVWRHIHIDRPVPDDVADRIRVDAGKGARLRATDRFPFYCIVCAQIRESPPTRARPPSRLAGPGDGATATLDGLELRSLSEEDGPAARRINGACPIEAGLTVRFDRGPDFFLWPDLVYERYHYVGLFSGDDLVGYCMGGERRGFTGTTSSRFFYCGDARLLREFRGRRRAEGAIRHLRRLAAPEVEVGFGLVARGNLPAERTVTGGDYGDFVNREQVPFAAANVMMLRKLDASRGNGAVARHATPADLDAMATLFNRVNGRRLFAPELRGGDIERCMTYPGLGPDHWYVAEKGRRLVGMLAAWDQGSFHRTVVLQYARGARALRAVHNGIRGLLPDAAPLPREGESFRTLTTTRVAVEDSDPGVFRSLLGAVNNDFMGRGYHMVHVGLVGRDPLAAALRGLMAQRFESTVFVMARGRGRRRCGWTQRPPYIDLEVI